MEKLKHDLKASFTYLLSFLKWMAAGIAVGTIVGIVGVGFYYVMKAVTAVRTAHPLIMLGLPICGVVIAFFYKKAAMHKGLDTNLVLLSVRSEEAIPLRMAPLIFCGTALTHLFGGSAGREGAALQLGGSIAQNIGKLLKMNQKELRMITMAGMSACFTALFGTPVTATVFAMEVVSVGAMYYAALVPCAAASLTAFLISRLCGVAPEHFTVTGIPDTLSAATAAKTVVLAALCAVVSILFCATIKYTGIAYRKLFQNVYLRAAAGGALLLGLTFLFYTLTGEYPYNGAGMDVIEKAMHGNAAPYAFALKILFTALTLGAGFKGGEIVPTFYIGSTFGCVAGKLLRLSPSFSAALGLVAMFCGVTNSPIASVFLSLELFGAKGLIWFLMASAAGFMLSGYFGLYKEQKILYSKELPEFINTTVNNSI